MAIHVHVGAHKTATTYIQHQLLHNSEPLRAHGVVYVPMREFRAWRTRTQRGASKRGAAALRAEFERFYERFSFGSICIISDENMIGSCNRIVEEGSLYAGLRKKLGSVAAMLEGRELKVFVAIRSYDSFYAAALCEAARSGSYVTFKNFSRSLDAAARRWPDVLTDIAELFPSAPIVVWPYELFRDCEEQVLESLLGVPMVHDLDLSHQVVRPSIPHQAMMGLEFLGLFAPFLARAGVVRVAERGGRMMFGDQRYSPWTEEQKEHLLALYEEDLARIEANSRFSFIGDARACFPSRL